ncbi:hypothetical protein, partial [Thiolapillus sp.]|uniref:hypothetical protein n=1 Tax=Thiolapillus sp. TaxID=2017437 RepID=UPI003AF446E1
SLALTLNLTCQSLIKTGNCQIKSELLQVILISHLSKYTSRTLTIRITGHAGQPGDGGPTFAALTAHMLSQGDKNGFGRRRQRLGISPIAR